MKTIAIIGGGFSGALTAIQLLQKSENIIVKIVNCNYPLTRGVAYSTDETGHLLNVPAGKMSAFEDQPDHFINWLRVHKEHAHFFNRTIENQFLPRNIYGKYLTALFEPYKHNKQLEVIESKAIMITQLNKGFSVRSDNNTSFEADKVVLAMGNFQPALPKIKSPAFFKNVDYFNDPWSTAFLKDCKLTEDILLIGTGLTMVDCALSLKKAGFKGHIYVTSPRGYTPSAHEATIAYPDFYSEIENSSLADIFKTVRKHIDIAGSKNISWHSVVDTLRPYVQTLWMRFSQKEKQQFISHIRHIWGVSRHRLPKETYNELMDMKEKGQLEIIGGRIIDLSENDKSILATIKLRKGGSLRELNISRVVNCTGPQINYAELNDELITGLLSSGLISLSPLKMGIRTTRDKKVIKNNNSVEQNIYAIGSLLRGVLWETTAVPELRVQAESIAKQIIGSIQ